MMQVQGLNGFADRAAFVSVENSDGDYLTGKTV
jgi:hypothetical protein